MSRATDEAMDSLHALQCATLMAEVKRYTEWVNPETGKVEPQAVPPALLAQVSKFLKDNSVDSPTRAANVRDTLRDTLPSLEDVEVTHQGYQ